MLSTADERRECLRSEFVCRQEELRKTTSPTEFVHIEKLTVSKSSVSCIKLQFCKLNSFNELSIKNNLKRDVLLSEFQSDEITFSFRFRSFTEQYIWRTVFDAAAAKVGLIGHIVTIDEKVSAIFVYI